MKVQLLQAGYTSFTGRLGIVQFAGGISVYDVDPNTAAGLAANFQMQWTNAASPTPTVSPIDMTDPTNQFLGNGVDAMSAQVAAGVGQTTAQVVAAGIAAEAPSTSANVTTYSGEFFNQSSPDKQTGAPFVPETEPSGETVDITGVHGT